MHACNICLYCYSQLLTLTTLHSDFISHDLIPKLYINRCLGGNVGCSQKHSTSIPPKTIQHAYSTLITSENHCLMEMPRRLSRRMNFYFWIQDGENHCFPLFTSHSNIFTLQIAAATITMSNSPASFLCMRHSLS